VVERPVAAPDCRAWKEAYYPTHPAGGFVDASDGRVGLALFTQGLREYELVDNPSRPLALTLLRAHRESMTVHVPERREELRGAGRYCPGRLAFRCAVLPHQGNWLQAELHRHFAEFRNDPEVVQFQAAARGGAERREGLRLAPAGLVLSALKRCEERDSLAVRFFNPSDREVEAVLEAGGLRTRSAWLLRLDERRLRRLPVDRSGRVRLGVGKKKIVTVELAGGR
jgi:alpha-mannosidase